MKKLLLIAMVFVLISPVLAENVVDREYNPKNYVGDAIEIKLLVDAESKLDIAEFISVDFDLVNESLPTNVVVETRGYENGTILHFEVQEDTSQEIVYYIVSNNVGKYELESIITSSEGFEKEVHDFNIIPQPQHSIFWWVVLILILVIIIDKANRNHDGERNSIIWGE